VGKLNGEGGLKHTPLEKRLTFLARKEAPKEDKKKKTKSENPPPGSDKNQRKKWGTCLVGGRLQEKAQGGVEKF